MTRQIRARNSVSTKSTILAGVSAIALLALLPNAARAAGCTIADGVSQTGACTGTAGGGAADGTVGALITNTTTATYNGAATGGSASGGFNGGAGISITGSGTDTVSGSATGGSITAGVGNTGAGIVISGSGTVNVTGETVTGYTGISTSGASAALILNMNGTGSSNTINLSGGGSGFGTDALTGASNTTTNFTGTNTLNGNLIYSGTNTWGLGGTVSIGTTAATTVTGTITLPGVILKDSIQSTQATSGQIVNTSNSASISIQNVELQPLVVGVGLATGEKIVLIKNGNAATTTNVNGAVAQTATSSVASDTTYNTLVRKWSVQDASSASYVGLTDKWGTTIGAHDIVLLATINKLSAIVSGRSDGQGAAFDAGANYTSNGTNSDMVSLNQALQNLNTTDQIRKAADQLRPEASGATVQASSNSITNVIRVDAARLQAVRLAANGGTTGLAAGDAIPSGGVWLQGIGGVASQSAQDGYSGYSSHTTGAAMGADVAIGESGRIGVSGAYAKGHVDETDNRSGDTLDVDSYIASIYGSYTGSSAYIDVIGTAARHDYSGVRQVSLSNYGQTASSTYNGTQFGGKVEFGVPVAAGFGIVATPLVSVSYSHLSVGGYTETGGAGADLTVNGHHLNQAQSGLGGRLATTVKLSDSWQINPSISALWDYRFINGTQDVSASYAEGNGTSFVTTGMKPSDNGGTLGAAVEVAHLNDFTAMLAYEGEVRTGYMGHTGMAQVRYNF